MFTLRYGPHARISKKTRDKYKQTDTNPIRIMTALAEEIQKIADNADKCINYPIGEKLDEFFR